MHNVPRHALAITPLVQQVVTRCRHSVICRCDRCDPAHQNGEVPVLVTVRVVTYPGWSAA